MKTEMKKMQLGWGINIAALMNIMPRVRQTGMEMKEGWETGMEFTQADPQAKLMMSGLTGSGYQPGESIPVPG